MSLIGSFMNLAGPDLIIILLIILVLFGAKKLPELARGMGQAVKEFQKAKDEFSDELHKAGKSDLIRIKLSRRATKPTKFDIAGGLLRVAIARLARKSGSLISKSAIDAYHRIRHLRRRFYVRA